MKSKVYWIIYSRVSHKHPSWSTKQKHKVTYHLYKGESL